MTHVSNKPAKKNTNNKKSYSNPIKTVWGKVIIIVISVAMVAGILASLIYLMVQNFGNV